MALQGLVVVQGLQVLQVQVGYLVVREHQVQAVHQGQVELAVQMVQVELAVVQEHQVQVVYRVVAGHQEVVGHRVQVD